MSELVSRILRSIDTHPTLWCLHPHDDCIAHDVYQNWTIWCGSFLDWAAGGAGVGKPRKHRFSFREWLAMRKRFRVLKDQANDAKPEPLLPDEYLAARSVIEQAGGHWRPSA